MIVFVKGADRDYFSAYAGFKELYVMKGLYFNSVYHNICCDYVFISCAAYLYAGEFSVCIYCVFWCKLDAPRDCVRLSPEP